MSMTPGKIMIETANLKLTPAGLIHFEAIINDPARLERMLGVSIADEWISFPEAIPHSYEYLKANPDARGWWMYLFVHAKEKMLIGLGGFKGKADEAGMVEIGYGIAPAYRHRGLATEAAPLPGLDAWPFSGVTGASSHLTSTHLPPTKAKDLPLPVWGTTSVPAGTGRPSSNMGRRFMPPPTSAPSGCRGRDRSRRRSGGRRAGAQFPIGEQTPHA